MKTFFATPVYDGKPCIEFIHSLTASFGVLLAMGIDATITYHAKDAYVHRARNTLCRKFLASDATDLFFIDADMGWPADAPARLLLRPYEFIGGAYPFKQDAEDYPVSIRSNPAGTPLVDPTTGCISATMLPTGFWRLRRSVLEKLADIVDWYWDDGEKTPAFFATPVTDHEWIGEDVWFCRQWLSLGGQIWCDPDIDFAHVGTKEWAGNYHRFLLRQPGGSEHGKTP